MARDLGYPVDSLMRCQHNRVLPEGGKLWDRVLEQAPLGHIRFMLPAGRGRKSRTVEQEIRVQRVQLSDKAKGVLDVSCLVASEVNVVFTRFRAVIKSIPLHTTLQCAPIGAFP